ncbi:MAG: IS3 family transposase [Anaerolineales bacterium]
MSTDEKIALAREAIPTYTVPAVSAALDLPRSTWYYHRRHRLSYTEKYAHLRAPLEKIAREHPEYGYRRTTPELREQFGYQTNHKVVQRLHQAWDLPLIRGTRLPKPSGIRQVIEAAGDRVNLVAAKEEIEPFEVVYTDFTELPYADGRQTAHLMPIIDHATKLVLGWAVGERAVTELALSAWSHARVTLKQKSVPLSQVIVHNDQDPVYTGYRWTSQLLLKDKVRISYALSGARDNPEMEAFNSRFKTENRSLLLDTQTLAQLQALVAERMGYHNTERRHSTIGYRSPETYIATLQPWS